MKNNEMVYPFAPAEKIKKLKEAVEPYMHRKFEQVELKTKYGIKVIEKELPINPLQIPNTIIRTLRTYETFEYVELQNSLSKDFLMECLNHFAEFVEYVNNIRPYVPTKQQVVAYLQMTEASYNKLLNSRDESIVTAFETWESYIVDLTFTSAQNDMIKERTTNTRLKAKGIGHSISETQSEEMQELGKILDTFEVTKRLENLKKQINFKEEK